MRNQSRFLETIIVFDETVPIVEDDRTMHFSRFAGTDSADAGKSNGAGELEARLASAGPDDLYTLIYTSGTSGAPKGVMLTHRNILAALYATGCCIPLKQTDVSLCFLPLSHVFGQRRSSDLRCWPNA